MHFISFPISNIFSLIRPFIYTIPIYIIFNKCSYIFRSICKNQSSFAIFLSILILSFVTRSVWPNFNSDSMSICIYPLPIYHWQILILHILLQLYEYKFHYHLPFHLKTLLHKYHHEHESFFLYHLFYRLSNHPHRINHLHKWFYQFLLFYPLTILLHIWHHFLQQ